MFSQLNYDRNSLMHSVEILIISRNIMMDNEHF